jgi:hypothetical protein
MKKTPRVLSVTFYKKTGSIIAQVIHKLITGTIWALTIEDMKANIQPVPLD